MRNTLSEQTHYDLQATMQTGYILQKAPTKTHKHNNP